MTPNQKSSVGFPQSCKAQLRTQKEKRKKCQETEYHRTSSLNQLLYSLEKPLTISRKLMESYKTFIAIVYMNTCLPALNKLETLIWKRWWKGRKGKERRMGRQYFKQALW